MMANLMIEATKSSPYINFDGDKHHLIMKGESYPENIATFYEPVFAWLDTFLSHTKKLELVVDLEIIYFNSSSSKVLMDIFDKLDLAAKTDNGVIINWRYHEENEMALEYGE